MNLELKEQVESSPIPQDAKHVLEILTQLENHTAQLRKKLMSELKHHSNPIKLTLDKV